MSTPPPTQGWRAVPVWKFGGERTREDKRSGWKDGGSVGQRTGAATHTGRGVGGETRPGTGRGDNSGKQKENTAPGVTEGPLVEWRWVERGRESVAGSRVVAAPGPLYLGYGGHCIASVYFRGRGDWCKGSRYQCSWEKDPGALFGRVADFGI